MKLTETQNLHVSGIMRECGKQNLSLPSQVAYVLATVEHETNGTFLPVRESYWVKNPDEYNKTHHPDYYPFYGRGYVQLTWKENYVFYGKILNIDLVSYPDLAMQAEVARFILVHGFKHGRFTGKKLEDYVSKSRKFYINARRCINGRDQAEKIAKLAQKWEEYLQNAVLLGN
jgi:predicted chitinase